MDDRVPLAVVVRAAIIVANIGYASVENGRTQQSRSTDLGCLGCCGCSGTWEADHDDWGRCNTPQSPISMA